MSIETQAELEHPYGIEEARRVQAASEASTVAYQAAADERARLHESELAQPHADTLGDLNVDADRLHGYASWVAKQIKHPHPVATVNELSGFQRRLRLEWPLTLKGYPQLRRYVGALDDLRVRLIECFEARRY